MGKDFKLVIGDEREAVFREIFGSNVVCVRSPFAEKRLLGEGEAAFEAMCYILDEKELTSEQFDRVVQHVARKFDGPLDEVKTFLTERGLPLRATGASLVIEHPQRWLT